MVPPSAGASSLMERVVVRDRHRLRREGYLGTRAARMSRSGGIIKARHSLFIRVQSVGATEDFVRHSCWVGIENERRMGFAIFHISDCHRTHQTRTSGLFVKAYIPSRSSSSPPSKRSREICCTVFASHRSLGANFHHILKTSW